MTPTVISGKTVFKNDKQKDKLYAEKITPSMLVSPSFYSGNLAFFCRQELKFEKVTKIPFKFRLGSLQQVDYLEGKRGAGFY